MLRNYKQQKFLMRVLSIIACISIEDIDWIDCKEGNKVNKEHRCSSRYLHIPLLVINNTLFFRFFIIVTWRFVT